MTIINGERYKTTAMIADSLKAHHRKLFWIDCAYYGLFAVAGIIIAAVITYY